MRRPGRSGLFRGLLFCAIAALSLPTQAKQLWLIGGGEPVCSSIEPVFCVPSRKEASELFFSQHEALRGKQFRYTTIGRQTISGFDAWVGGLARRDAVLSGLDKMRPRIEGRSLSAKEWHALFEPLKLGEEEQGLLDDIFQVRVLRRDGGSQKALVFLDGGEPYVQAMFKAFVASAAGHAKARGRSGKPRIVFLTASSTDPLDDVDYYTSLFEQAGARADWLPLEPALIRARDCNRLETLRFQWNGVYARTANHPESAQYQREMCRHPERMRQLVDDADAFFINGGDQSLTLRSLQLSPGRFTPLAQRMLDRIESGIPLGGSSAGTAVQSGNKSSRVPMISGGDSEHALRHGAMAVEANTQLCQMHGNCAMHSDPDQLTYRAGGGLRTMSLGVVDTHFHEREREGRLLRLLLDTGTRFGFGVDEATVLKVDFRAGDDADLQVMGRGGVWLVDTGSATANRGDRQWMASGFRVARLLAGDTAQLRSGELSVDLRCLPDAQLKPGQIVDDTAYAKTKGRHWSRLADSNGVIACKRADGRWRYDRMRIQLIQDL